MKYNYNEIETNIANRLFHENYEDLIIIARARRRRSNQNQTLSTIDILHDSFIKLNGHQKWETREHFINAVSLAMRHVIIDYARNKKTVKRGENASKITYDDDIALLPEYWETPEQILEISNLMAKLENENLRWMRIVDARYFCGLTEQETAAMLNLSTRTIRRDWADARNWIAKRLFIS